MKGFRGQELKFNDDFRSISPSEFIEENTLVWIGQKRLQLPIRTFLFRLRGERCLMF